MRFSGCCAIGLGRVFRVYELFKSAIDYGLKGICRCPSCDGGGAFVSDEVFLHFERVSLARNRLRGGLSYRLGDVYLWWLTLWS